MLANKSIVLGVTGGIAAFKVAELASQLTKAGALIDVVMTRGAMEFIAPLTFQALTHRPVVTEMFRLLTETEIGHISLASRADLIVVAPATANVIAKLACGLADDMLTTTILATRAPVLIAPAMEENMLTNTVTQANIASLRERGMVFVESQFGRLASGKIGKGRMAEVDDLMVAIRKIIAQKGDLAGMKVVITAGGTHEPIDPVRFIGNRSSGKMGFALAEAARDRGAEVTLILGPTYLQPPKGVKIVNVETALDMKRAVEGVVADAHVLIMAAAVADFRVEQPAEQKIKREKLDGMDLHLVKNPDILAQVSNPGLVKVGFAAESQDLVENARAKLEKKHLQLIVANNITSPESGFGVDTNKVTLVDAAGNVTELPLMSKREVAEQVLNKVGTLRSSS
ncbi:MAG: bifunctional phosphopantothenoylcysteine decarboxylase/phosphopantothenate--cysteine ligase CoaBC [Chloroflexi bacterium]|nr:bifunctional phosphopantothenoylcysteine decarboxylase/phosphopantothenate--cysteine ligase CoaBC [Chloroflexota bacterium]MDA8189474.1 bifunctional phosphopantothenoylcysteine decarboxylase/phosphopantothenate--cysteine ligase CoaBC [Dehalococcoidales bacterium]